MMFMPQTKRDALRVLATDPALRLLVVLFVVLAWAAWEACQVAR
jgi:hypothetical protein